ncbi:MAG: dTMP kinase [Planctomycetota bacterium]|jgi:dTMP kinase
MRDLADSLRGKFIVLDGPDGAGKSTQLDLLAELLARQGAEVERVRDPGGTSVGDKIRQILLDRANGDMVPLCEMLLFMASRAQLIAEKVRPAVTAGKVVLCDRFISATIAYQGASGVEAQPIIDVGNLAVQGVWPDLTVVLDLPAEVGLERVGRRVAQAGQDRMEIRSMAYHQAVRENFLTLSKCYPRPVVVVDAQGEPKAVFSRVLEAIAKALC